jgi:hypothetical protein
MASHIAAWIITLLFFLALWGVWMLVRTTIRRAKSRRAGNGNPRNKYGPTGNGGGRHS